jgi:hypothetical protein
MGEGQGEGDWRSLEFPLTLVLSFEGERSGCRGFWGVLFFIGAATALETGEEIWKKN